jgi:hypothetical protein
LIAQFLDLLEGEVIQSSGSEAAEAAAVEKQPIPKLGAKAQSYVPDRFDQGVDDGRKFLRSRF